MREYYLTFDKGLRVGLRPSEDNPLNHQACVECHNGRASKNGLLPYNPLTLPTFGGAPPFPHGSLEVTAWPFPQLIPLKDYALLIVRDNVVNLDDVVYLIDSSNDLTELLRIDVLTYGAFGDQFDFADFGTYVIGTNGIVFLYYDVTLATWKVMTSSATIPLVKTLCNFKGQAVGGNVQSVWHGCGSNHVVWTKIGEMDFTPARDNEAGFMKMPWEGDVYRVMRLGDYVMVYGSGGIAALRPVTAPVPSFGLEELLTVGIPNKMAVGGDDNSHVFVDTEGYLWKVGRSLEVEKLGIGTSFPSASRLGYQEFLSSLSDIVVSKNPAEHEFYISDADASYLLTQEGMSGIHQLVTSCGRVNGSVVGLFDDSEDVEFRLTTDMVDMGFRGQKTIQTLELGTYTSNVVQTAVDWRVDKSAALRTSPWVLSGPQGVSTNIIAGTEFRLKMKVADYTDVDLSYITARYKMTDMRSIRGIYAQPPRGQE